MKSDAPFLQVTQASAEGTAFTCALCATRFTHGKQVCGSCPLNTGCSLVTCPSCGYSFPRSSFIVDSFRRFVSWVRGRKA